LQHTKGHISAEDLTKAQEWFEMLSANRSAIFGVTLACSLTISDTVLRDTSRIWASKRDCHVKRFKVLTHLLILPDVWVFF
jgi:hypothetical protein